MPDLDRIMAPLGAECDPEDSLADILTELRGQHPLPLLVTARGEVVGTVGLEVLIPASANDLSTVRVREVMRPAPELDAGEPVELAAQNMIETGAAAVLVSEPEGGLFSRRSRPVGVVSEAQVLAEIGRNVVDKAPMKILSGHRDLGFNVPVSPCQRNCPIKQDIATYVDYVSQGRYVDSWMVIHETNPFPSMLGRLCNHPCETDCKRGWDPGEDPVTIRSIKRFSTDFAFKQGLWVDYKIAPANGKRVAIVGAGPAGLTAALDLRVQGYEVHLYEREAKVGGLLSTSIPPFRFDHKQLQWELDMILATGIEVHTNSNIGPGDDDVKLDALLADFDAVFVTIGMMKGRILPVPGSDAPQVIDAMRFLRIISYDRIPEHFEPGKRVVVVGGGAIATDACQSSIKLGAKEVWMCAIEPEDRLPAFGNELHEAREIGLRMATGIIVKEVHTDDAGNVVSVSFQPLQDLDFDPLTGKLIFASVKEKEGVERVTIPCDYVIFASGQIMESPGDPMPLTPRGLIAADRGGHTGVEKLFAGGDCVQGPSFIVDAVGWGHRVARSIREYLGEDMENAAYVRLQQTIVERTDDHRQSEYFARTEPPILEAAKRYDMSECELPWTDREAIVQAIRCFQCDSVHHYDASVCVLCGACDDVCPEKAIDVVVFGEDRERSSGGDTLVCETSGGNPVAGGYEGEIFINYDRCTNCRICEDHCPVNCITFERVRFVDDTMRVRELPELKKILPVAASA
ncbi:MAG TPA: FAD-dependent oxidoreductase [Candidatus Dormibacteraeota bacterium]|jgi:NADPH-dependent glutamate synthase beta subunit-like oxidoreductase/ferredoxin|nr:FAD-dependent oxidoreductase [Candidatus Dormibacteraeota bacterium]